MSRMRKWRRARGTEEFWVPAVLAAVSSGAQYENQQSANSRQQSAEVQAINNQQQMQQDALSQVNRLTKNISQSTPTQIQAQATGDYVANLRKNEAGAQQSGTNSSLAPINGSPQYNKGVTASQAAVNQFGNTEAGEMGAIDAAPRQRQMEGLSQSSLQTALNGLSAKSATQGWVDQLRAAAAGQANPWVNLAAGAIGDYSNYLSKQQPGSTTYINNDEGTGIQNSFTAPNAWSFLPNPQNNTVYTTLSGQTQWQAP